MSSKYKLRYFKVPDMKTQDHFLVGFEWDITGSTGNSYTIELHDQGLECSCPGFGWQGKCKHVKALAHRLTTDNYPRYQV